MVQRSEEQLTSNQGPQATIRIAHLSDVHFGKISYPGIVEALVSEVNAEDMDLVVVSGDLTQRATDDQYRDARSMLDAFTASVLVVPGNHDVRQFWHNPIERVIHPTTRFERYITDDLMPTFSKAGISVFGMNTAHGLTIKGGLVRKEALAAMRGYFASRPKSDARILVVHHHLIKDRAAFGRTDIAFGSRRVLHAAAAGGVDLILCGHFHISDAAAYPADYGREIIVASAGTATSSRGRGDHKAINLYNWISIDSESIAIEARKYDVDSGQFSPERMTRFARQEVRES